MCFANVSIDNCTDWRYRYNQAGECEQRLMYGNAAQPYKPFVYYLLGWGNEQYAVLYRSLEEMALINSGQWNTS